MNLITELQDIHELIEETLDEKKDFMVAITNAGSTTYTRDRANYLQFWLEVAGEQLEQLIDTLEDIQIRAEQLANM